MTETTNTDVLTNRIQTLPIDQVTEREQTDPYGLTPMTRVTSPMAAVVVRRDGVDGPTYQEARGYSFLINSIRYPRIVRLDDGRLVLSATGALHPGYIEDPIRYVDDPIMLFSDDQGRSWSQPRREDMQGALIGLGGERLMMHGGNRMRFSDDGGMTWSADEPVPPLPDGRVSHLHGSALVEGDVMSTISYVENVKPEESKWLEGQWTAQSVLRRFHVSSRTWEDPYFFPMEWRTSEGALARAANGDLVAAFRTGRPGIPVYADHWRGISTSTSSDNGKTWTEPAIHFLYGHHHMELLTLPDGRILMTYAARIGELEGMNYHGAEAVLSYDHGATWDWEHRYIIFRWHDQGMHSPSSVRLGDGRILTIFLHGESYSWMNRDPDATWDAGKWSGGMNLIGNVSVVIWSVD